MIIQWNSFVDIRAIGRKLEGQALSPFCALGIRAQKELYKILEKRVARKWCVQCKFFEVVIRDAVWTW